MKLKIKLFLWQLWLTLVVWVAFFTGDFTGWYNFFVTASFEFVAFWIVWGLLYLDFSAPSDYYSGFFGNSPEIASVIDVLVDLSVFFGAVLAGLVSLVAYSIFDDEYVAMSALEVFVSLFAFLVIKVKGTEGMAEFGRCGDWRDYISKRYFDTSLVIGSLLIIAPMLWQLFTHQEQIKAALGF
jgi:hypothetical protein